MPAFHLPFSQRLLPLFVLTLSTGFALEARADQAPSKPNKARTSAWSYSATLGLSNDNLPAPQVFASTDRLDPGYPILADDDGRTFGVSFEQVLTNERRGLQLLTSTWYEMLTQDGAQENPSRDRRADVLNNIFQVNQRFDFGAGMSLYMGLGIGAQTVGNMDGISLQAWWHEKGGFGGRHLGWGLQDDYGDMQGTVTVPAMSPGVRLGKLFGSEEHWNARIFFSGSALLALGRSGMSFGQIQLGGRVGHPKVANVWAGVFVSGGSSNDGYLTFAPIGHGMLGYEIGTSLNFLHKIGVPISTSITIQSNGSGFADTTFTIGFIFGRGSWAWLGPPR